MQLCHEAISSRANVALTEGGWMDVKRGLASCMSGFGKRTYDGRHSRPEQGIFGYPRSGRFPRRPPFTKRIANGRKVPDPAIVADWKPCSLSGDRRAIRHDRHGGANLPFLDSSSGATQPLEVPDKYNRIRLIDETAGLIAGVK